MLLRKRRSTGMTLLSVVLAVGFTLACQSKSSSKPGEAINISGAGSTFVNPIMSRWTSDYQKQNPNVFINYQSVGSGAGIQQVKNGLVDFGASDAPLDDQQLSAMAAVVQIPESAGPVCLTYTLPGVQNLKLTPEALSGIYLGTIKNWQDPAISQANSGVTLPNSAILVVHRSDGSGTTNIFTSYLAAVSPQWRQKVGKGISVRWPVGLGGKGSEGVTGVVRQTTGAIGYVEPRLRRGEQVALRRSAEQGGQICRSHRSRLHCSHCRVCRGPE